MCVCVCVCVCVFVKGSNKAAEAIPLPLTTLASSSPSKRTHKHRTASLCALYSLMHACVPGSSATMDPSLVAAHMHRCVCTRHENPLHDMLNDPPYSARVNVSNVRTSISPAHNMAMKERMRVEE